MNATRIALATVVASNLILTSGDVITTEVTLTGASQLIAMGGTGMPTLPNSMLDKVVNVINAKYETEFGSVIGTGAQATDSNVLNLHTPEGVYTDTYLDGEQALLAALQQLPADPDVTVFGVSQSAGIVGMAIRDLVADPGNAPADIHWIALAPPSMPKHGNAIGLAHQPLFEAALAEQYPAITDTFPTDSGAYVTDVYCGMYDPICDSPVGSSNLATVWNSLMGLTYVHGGYSSLTPDELAWEIDHAQLLDISTDSTNFYLMPSVVNFGTVGDPDYQTLLPSLAWLTWNRPLYDLLAPVTQVQVDAGYSDDAHTFLGQVVTDGNLQQLMTQAWQVGWDAMISDLGIEDLL